MHPGFTPSVLVLAFSFPPMPALASAGLPPPPIPPSCSEPAKGISLPVPEYTGYKPGQGWPNGSCNGGASRGKGITACKHTLDKYIGGNSNFIHVAAQQHGGSAKIFGCWGRTDGFEKRGIPKGKNSCHMLAIADHYGDSESEGHRGVNGKIQKVKVDVEVDPKSKQYSKLGSQRASNIECVSRIFGMTNREKPAGARTVKRNPQAQARQRSKGSRRRASNS